MSVLFFRIQMFNRKNSIVQVVNAVEAFNHALVMSYDDDSGSFLVSELS